MLVLIAKYINHYIGLVEDKFVRECNAKETDVIEIKEFIGLLYLAGSYRGNRQSLEELWGTEEFGTETFGLVMSIKRFRFLMRYIRFDDRASRAQPKEYHRLCPVRFRGSCPFRQYIPSKHTKYGIKLFALVDARTVYTYNVDIYAGKQPEGPFRVNKKPSEIMKRMTEPLCLSGRNVTTNRESLIQQLVWLQQW
ncbi:uncharacterized protein LOC117171101 [Belonocnema kinseyi]|uniref:uncharacterized protein LOC117171101 n=1 Tax=Belonocnema kinseyi TaxID=2817044 RepID=UPI00143D1531|nr:uncharacterized protein LOC117171101 [Belonocnema kinseyi]